MEVFQDLYSFALDVLYSLGTFCDGVFDLLTFELSVNNAFGHFEFTLLEVLFGAGLGVVLGYKIILGLIPLV